MHISAHQISTKSGNAELDDNSTNFLRPLFWGEVDHASSLELSEFIGVARILSRGALFPEK